MSNLIIIPTYNESANIKELIALLSSNLPDMSVLVVDDNSPDGTGIVADEIRRSAPGAVHVLHREGPRGLGRALTAGFEWATSKGFENIVTMDADLSHSPEDLPMLVKPFKEVDVVLGSRYLNKRRIANWPVHRLALSTSAGIFSRALLRIEFTDPTTGFRAFTNSALKKILSRPPKSTGFFLHVEVLTIAKSLSLKIKEVPITFAQRLRGQTKMSAKEIVKGFWGVVRLCLSK